jgi:Peptidase family M23
MKGRLLPCLLLILSFPASLLAQNDSIRLVCPLNEATVIPPPRNVIHYDPPDLCVVLVSIPDTVVKACVAGKITNVEASSDEEGGWDVVLFCKYKTKEYYFWYSGLSNVNVRRNDDLKAGQPIGTIRPGGKVELLMYDFETQVDPTGYMDCKRVVSQ